MKKKEPKIVREDIYSLKQFKKIDSVMCKFFQNQLNENAFGYVLYMIHSPINLIKNEPVYNY